MKNNTTEQLNSPEKAKPKDINRQAVIVIHGMGEQRPMDTLRGFVDGIKAQMELNDQSEKKVKVRSKPDSIGDIYETVRLSMESNYDANRPITDFYEFYWAHNMRGTTISHMATWIKHLVFFNIGKVPSHLKHLWWTVWSIIGISFILMFVITFFFNVSLIWKTIITLFGGTILSLIWTSIASSIKSSFLNSLGDVARYITPEPDNIHDRSQIRQQGINFLRKLHSVKNRTSPDRIIIVAHSLGSVVAYDLMRLLWTEYNTVYTTPSNDGQPHLDLINEFAKNPDTITTDPQKFREAQNNYWKEARQLGNPWLITDFVTLGAALNSMDYFMVNSASFEKLIEQREIPICPPEIDAKDKKIYYRDYIEQDSGERRKGINVTHHGALFAMTRWTNIYFSSDFVGGPMQRRFGKGILDIKIARKSIWFYPGGHTDYWTPKENNIALSKIVEAMQLSRNSVPNLTNN